MTVHVYASVFKYDTVERAVVCTVIVALLINVEGVAWQSPDTCRATFTGDCGVVFSAT